MFSTQSSIHDILRRIRIPRTFFLEFGACADSVYQALLPSLTLLKPLTMVYVTSSSQIRVFGAYGDLGYTCTL